MESDHGRRPSHRDKPIGTSKTRAIVARVIHPQGRVQYSPNPVPPIAVRTVGRSLRFEIPTEPVNLLATRTEKSLPGVPDEHTNINGPIEVDDRSFPTFDLLPRRLEITKKRERVDFAQRIHELTQQNGYLLAEVELLKETRLALKELQDQTQEAFWVLQAALHKVSDRIETSERRLMNYWGTHSGDRSDEVTAF